MFNKLNFIIMDSITIQLNLEDAKQVTDLLYRINSKYKRAIAKYHIAPEVITIEEKLNVFKEESIALTNAIDQLIKKLRNIE